jgi:hypothetical protein
MQNDIKQELYDLYKYALEDASSMWLSEYCCSAKEGENRRKSDEEDLKYFKELLQKLRAPGQ